MTLISKLENAQLLALVDLGCHLGSCSVVAVGKAKQQIKKG